MKQTILWRLCTGLLLFSVLLTACGGGQAAPPTLAATQPPPATTQPASATEQPAVTTPAASSVPFVPPAFTSVPSGKVTKDGFNCPEPNPRMQITSKELNLFVWTEYIPQDFFECFQLVYGITVNYDEYSSNEEMDGKVSKGTTAYDLVQPTDYTVTLLIRQGLLQPMDHSKLPVLANFNPIY